MIVQLVQALRYDQKVWAQFPMVYTEFFIHLILLSAVWALEFKPGVNDLMSTIKTQGL